MMIAIPLLPIGNSASIVRMVAKAGGDAQLIASPSELRHADRIILAGVGAFDKGMVSLRERGWPDALQEAVFQHHIPILGICLGMQMMCKFSDEGSRPGLGWIDADVKRFCLPENTALKIPHMGWNTVKVVKPNPLISVSGEEQRYYFVHSFHVTCHHPEDVMATTHHGCDVIAAFCRGNIYGVQFHPEKSHRFGMVLFEKFLAL